MVLPAADVDNRVVLTNAGMAFIAASDNVTPTAPAAMLAGTGASIPTGIR